MNAGKQANDTILEKNANVAGRGKNVLRVTGPKKGINCEMDISRHNPSTNQPLLSPVVTRA